MSVKIRLENLISEENLNKFKVTKFDAIHKVVNFFKNKSQHGYFFASISIGESMENFVKMGGNPFDRIIHCDYKTAVEDDYTDDEVCLVFEEFSRISALKNNGENSSCIFYDIDDDRNIEFLGSFEGIKEGERFQLNSILVEDVNEVMSSKEYVRIENESADM